MKKLMAVAAVLGIVAMSSMAFAQAEPRDVGIFGDAAGTMTSMDVAGFAPFNIYMVGFGLDGEVKGFEAGVTGLETFTILAAILNPANALNLGNNTNYLVGTGGCFPGMPSYLLVTINAGYFAGPVAPADNSVCISAADPSSPALGGRPGYLQCDGTLVPFGLAENGGAAYADGCFVLNATGLPPVATETTSFGEIKARF